MVGRQFLTLIDVFLKHLYKLFGMGTPGGNRNGWILLTGLFNRSPEGRNNSQPFLEKCATLNREVVISPLARPMRSAAVRGYVKDSIS